MLPTAFHADSLRVRFVNERGSIVAEVASASEPRRWIELGFQWAILTGDRPTPELDGWAGFLREHIRELAEALGPRLAATAEAVQRQERENEETLTRYRTAWNPTFIGVSMRFYRGPLGWIVAAAVLAWAIFK